MTRFYSQFIQKNDTCFDIGANVGSRTDVFLKLGAKVVCVEPQHVCVEQLRVLFGNNPDVIIVDQAVGDMEGCGELALCEDAPIISTMSDKWKNQGRFARDHVWGGTQKISISTLDVLISRYGLPVFCKIDVEGFEEPVLRGLTQPIPFISFEFTREFFDDAKKCIDHLISIGSVTFNCSIGESMNLLFPIWVTPHELYQKLDSLDDPLLWGDIYAKFLCEASEGSVCIL